MWSPLRSMALLAAASLLATTVTASHQFHLSLVGGTDYMLDWVTPTTTNSSVLIYGTSQTKLDRSIPAKPAGTVEQSAGAEVTCWSALLHNLKPGNTIYYALKDANDSATPFSFTVPSASITWAVFGDLASPIQKQASGVSLPALKKELQAGAYQGLLNLGDLSYELIKGNGENYMEELQDIGSKVPIQTTIGNHEYQYAMAPEFALRNYIRRFAGIKLGAGTASGSDSNEFFSFNSGLVHFVFLNTEVYGDESFFIEQADGSWKPDEAARRSAALQQVAWLEYDLSRVDRSVTPYVVMGGHRPPFKTPQGLDVKGNRFVTEIVPIMSKYDVDLYLAGHEHIYMVSDEYKIGEYRVPPVIVSGSPGNNEFIRVQDQLRIVGLKYKTIIPKYGYGYLTATATALEWKWGSTATDATNSPKSKDWTQEDALTIPRRTVTSASIKVGTAVKEPQAVTAQWVLTNTGGSGASSGSGGDAKGNNTSPSKSSGAATTTLSSAAYQLFFGAIVVALAIV